jgi:predicted RNase H-like HicB family nuclease
MIMVSTVGECRDLKGEFIPVNGWYGHMYETRVYDFAAFVNEFTSCGYNNKAEATRGHHKMVTKMKTWLLTDVPDSLRSTTLHCEVRKRDKHWVAECLELGVFASGNTLENTCDKLESAIQSHLAHLAKLKVTDAECRVTHTPYYYWRLLKWMVFRGFNSTKYWEMRLFS